VIAPNGEPVAPYSHEAEVAVLGGVLIDPEAITAAAGVLTGEMFGSDRHRVIYAAALRLFDRGVTIDPVTIAEELHGTGDSERAGGLLYLAELMDAVPTAANIAHHAEIVRDRAIERQLLRAGQEIIADVAGQAGLSTAEKVERAAERILSLSLESEAGSEPEWIKRLLYPAFERIEQMQGAAGGLTGVPSGFVDLDEMTGGFHKGDLVILAARPSMGKTAIATGMALHAAIMHQVPVAIYSLEMSKEQIVQRMLCHEALVDLAGLRRGEIRDADLVRLAQAAGHLNTAPLYIDDRSATTMPQFRASVRRLKQQIPDLGMIILDYVQYMAGSGKVENRQQEVSQISRGLKFLAKEVGVPIIALSQLSRALEQRTDKRPQLSDLRESGSLEQDADLVLFVHRPERFMTPAEAEEKGLIGKAELIVGKQRNGPTGIVDLYFRKECARFESLTRREDPDTHDRHRKAAPYAN
jgi:replicative DNA helicase